MSVFVIAYDVGTTGIKTCIYEIADSIKLIASDVGGYRLYIEDNGGAEQDPDELWSAMCTTTQKVIESSGLSAGLIEGISFCSQM